MVTPKFLNTKPSFHGELKKRISEYFEKKGIDTTGNYKLWLKAGILVTALLVLYIHLVFFTPGVVWALLECALMGLVIAGIGFNVMHDGAHGSFSRFPSLNKIAAITLSILGGSHFMWNVKHNVIHHAYTNIDGIDDDIDARPFLRMATTQKRYKMHKYQHFYFWILYSILYAYWIFFSDFKKYFSKKIGSMPLKKMSVSDHITFWTLKTLSIGIFLIAPIFIVGLSDTLIGYLVILVVAGLVISIVFQLAHTVEHTEFPMPDVVTNKMEDEWAIHQIKTTANFATKNKFVSWCLGGLNFQIEHHLFPKISHVHYPAISKIVKQACTEYGVDYIEYPKVSQAVISHISFLKQMGKAS